MGVYEEGDEPKPKLNRRQRRALRRKPKEPEMQWPDFMRGLSNHDRMMLKKVGRGGVETRSRTRRNNKISEV